MVAAVGPISLPALPAAGSTKQAAAREADSTEGELKIVMCGRTVGRSDKELLALTQRLAEQRTDELRNQMRNEVKSEASTRTESGGRVPKWPQFRRARQKEQQKPVADIMPRTPRPPSLSAVSASIQSEMAQTTEFRDLSDIGTLDRWWEKKNIELEKILMINAGSADTGGEQVDGMVSFRSAAGSLDKDPILYETRLPSSHVEAWLTAVMARAGDELGMFKTAVAGLRAAVGLPPHKQAVDIGEPQRIASSATGRCLIRQHVTSPRGVQVDFEEDPCLSHEQAKFGLELVNIQPVHKDGLSPEDEEENEEDEDQEEARSEGKHDKYDWLRQQPDVSLCADQDTKCAGPTSPPRLRVPVTPSFFREYRADRLGILGLDRCTLSALGLDRDTIDRTYRALYVHAVGAHMLVRRACLGTSYEHRTTLAAALWLMFMYLVESTEDFQYKSAISRVRLAAIAHMEQATRKLENECADEREVSRACKEQLRACDACLLAFAGDAQAAGKEVKELTQYAINMKTRCLNELSEARQVAQECECRCIAHEAAAAWSTAAWATCAHTLSQAQTSLEETRAAAETTRAAAETTRGELEFLKNYQENFQEEHVHTVKERDELSHRVMRLEHQLERALKEAQGAQEQLKNEKSRRVETEEKYARLQKDVENLTDHVKATTQQQRDDERIGVQDNASLDPNDTTEDKDKVEEKDSARNPRSVDCEVEHEACKALARELKILECEALIWRHKEATRPRPPELVDACLSPIEVTPLPSPPPSRSPSLRRLSTGRLSISRHRRWSSSTSQPEVLARKGVERDNREDDEKHVHLCEAPAPSAPYSSSPVMSGCTTGEEGTDEEETVDAFETMSAHVRHFAVQETAAKLVSGTWMQTLAIVLVRESGQRRRALELWERLQQVEQEALPASHVALDAYRARADSLQQDLEETCQKLCAEMLARQAAEERAHIAETASKEAEEMTSLRTRNKVLYKTSIKLGTQLDQAREMTRVAHKRVLEHQKIVNKYVDRLAEAEARERQREEEHDREQINSNHAALTAKEEMAVLRERNDMLSDQVQRLKNVDLADAAVRSKASTQLLQETIESIQKVIDAHLVRGNSEAEDWRRRGAAYGPPIAALHNSYKMEEGYVVETDNNDKEPPPARGNFTPWPTEMVGNGGVNRAVDIDMVRPPIDLDIAGAVIDTSIGNFFDQQVVDHAEFQGSYWHTSMTLNDLRWPRPIETRSSESQRAAVPPYGTHTQKTGVVAAAALLTHEVQGMTVAIATAASATVRRLTRVLALTQRQARSSKEERDCLSRQIVWHLARDNILSRRCDVLITAAERLEKEHKAQLEQRDTHRRTLVMNAHRLKQQCDAETSQLRETLKESQDRERMANIATSRAIEVVSMATEDAEARELRRWELAFLVDVAALAEEAVDAGKGMSIEGNETDSYVVANPTKGSSKEDDKMPVESKQTGDDDTSMVSTARSSTGGRRPRRSVRNGRKKEASTPGTRRRQCTNAKIASEAAETAQALQRSDQIAKSEDINSMNDEPADLSEEFSGCEVGIPNHGGATESLRDAVVRDEPTCASLDGMSHSINPKLSALEQKKHMMHRKVDKTANSQWLVEHSNVCLSQLWLSPQQQALQELRVTCSRLTGLFDSVRQRYMAAHARVLKLSGVLERMTVAYNQLKKLYTEQVHANHQSGKNAYYPADERNPNRVAKVPSLPRQWLTPESGQDEEVQTKTMLYIRRQVQTDLSWVHGCLISHKSVQCKRKDHADEAAWADTSELIQTPTGLVVRVQDYDGELFREANGVSFSSGKVDESILNARTQSPGSQQRLYTPPLQRGESLQEVEAQVASLATIEQQQDSGTKDEAPKAQREDRDPQQDHQKNRGETEPPKSDTLENLQVLPGIGVSLHDMLKEHEEYAAATVAKMQRAASDTAHGVRQNEELDPLELPPEEEIHDDEEQFGIFLSPLQVKLQAEEKMGAIMQDEDSLDDRLALAGGVLAEAAARGQQVPPEVESALAVILRYRAGLTSLPPVQTQSTIAPSQAANQKIDCLLAKLQMSSAPENGIVAEEIDETPLPCDLVRVALDALQSGDDPFVAMAMKHAQRDQGETGTPDARIAETLRCASSTEAPPEDVAAARRLLLRMLRISCQKGEGDQEESVSGVALKEDVFAFPEQAASLEAQNVATELQGMIEFATARIKRAEEAATEDREKPRKWNTERIELPPGLLGSVKDAISAGNDPVACVSAWFGVEQTCPEKQPAGVAYLRKLARVATSTKKSALAVARARRALLGRIADAFEKNGGSNPRENAGTERKIKKFMALEREKERAALRRVHTEHNDDEDDAESTSNSHIAVRFRIRQAEIPADGDSNDWDNDSDDDDDDDERDTSDEEEEEEEEVLSFYGSEDDGDDFGE